MYKTLLITLINAFIFHYSFSQSINLADTTRAEEYYDKGYELLVSGSYPNAIKELEEAANIYSQLKQSDKLLKTELAIAECEWRLGQFEQSSERLWEIIVESEEAMGQDNIYEASAYHNLSVINSINGNLDSAFVLNTKEVRILESFDLEHRPLPELSTGYNLRGIIFFQRSNVDSAIYYLANSLEISIKLNGKDNLNVARSYNNIGAMYMSKGELDKAESYFNNALSIRQKNNFQDPVGLSNLYKNIGTTKYDQGEFQEALENYQKAYSSISKIGLEEDFRAVGLLQNLGNANNQLQNIDSALYYQRKAVAIIARNYPEGHYFYANAYNNLGFAHLNAEQYDSAAFYFQKSLDINVAHLTERNSEVLLNYYNLANTALLSNNYDDALKIAQQGVSLNLLHDKSDTSNYQISEIDEFIHFKYLWSSLLIKAKASEELSNQNQDPQFLIVANETYKLGVDLIDSMKTFYQYQSDKIRIAKEAKPVYSGALRTQRILNDKFNNSEDLRSSEFKIVQQYKASSLLAINTEISARKVLGVPDSLIVKEEELKLRLNNLQSQLVNQLTQPETDTSAVAQIYNDLFIAREERESLESILQASVPEYYELKYERKVIEPEELQKNLDKNSMLIEFYDGDNIITAFTITKNNFKRTLIDRNEVLVLYESYNNSDNQDEADLYEMYESLIGSLEIPTSIKNLTIVPDGFLWNVNFELLKYATQACSSPIDCPYLMNRFNISYAYSSYLFAKQQSKQRAGSNHIVAFSYADETDDDTSGNISLALVRNQPEKLPGSSSEITAISEYVDGDYYYGANASEANFKSVADNYSLIHLAIHGEVNDNQPNNSKLIFYSEGDSLEDGSLHAFELYNMSLDSKLAVLSACNSGAGKLETGEGFMSLGRAFSYAGVPSLLLNRWDVSDVTAPLIMKYFYEGLSQGMRKSEALNYAKRQFLINDADNITSSQFYWAGFYILGDDQPIIEDSWWKNPFAWGLVLLVLIIVFLWYRRRGPAVAE